MKPRDGRDGRDADPLVIKAEVERAISELPPLKGEKGDKGDKGDRGEKGDKGDPGPKGDPGKDGAVFAKPPTAYRFTVLRDDFDRIMEVIAIPMEMT